MTIVLAISSVVFMAARSVKASLACYIAAALLCLYIAWEVTGT